MKEVYNNVSKLIKKTKKINIFRYMSNRMKFATMYKYIGKKE